MKTLRSLCSGILALAFISVAGAATTSFGPTPYLQFGDAPDDFLCPDCIAWVEDFELGTVDPFLSIDNGEILMPNAFSGVMNSVTDSVDGDDGVIDGWGNAGYSWFTGADSPDDNQVTVTFESPVKSAGLVFTDGPRVSTMVTLEAFDMGGNSLGFINGGDLADDFFTGETEEDSFMGFMDTDAQISSITLSVDAGVGIEIDHIYWQEDCVVVPEPATQAMCFMAILGLAGVRRRRD